MMTSKKVLLITAAFLTITGQAYAMEFGENSWNLENKYLNIKLLPPGTTLVTSGYGTKSQIYSTTNILYIEIVDGVKCIRVNSIRTETAEISFAWIAQDIYNNVYVLKYFDMDNPAPVFLGKDPLCQHRCRLN